MARQRLAADGGVEVEQANGSWRRSRVAQVTPPPQEQPPQEQASPREAEAADEARRGPEFQHRMMQYAQPRP